MDVFGQQVKKLAKKMKRNTKSRQQEHNHEQDPTYSYSSSNTSRTLAGREDTAERSGAQRPEGIDAEVEKARKAVERKLMYLSETNHTAGPSRTARSSGGKGRGDGKHGKKQQFKDVAVGAGSGDNIRGRGSYNAAALDSARRNGLSLSDDQDDSEMESSLSRRLQDVVLEAEEAERRSSGVYGRQQMIEKPIAAYTCSVCGAKFQIKSLLGAHRRTHDEDFSVRFRPHRPRASNTNLTNGHLCKFCDRKFDLERTLHIHLMCHCKKIPPQQRRTLPFTELLHEKKAPLNDQRM